MVSPGLGNTHLEALCDGPKPTSTSTLKIFTLSVFVCGERPKKYSMSRRWRYMSHVFFMISPVQKINLAWIRTLVRAVLGKSGILAKKIKKKEIAAPEFRVWSPTTLLGQALTSLTTVDRTGNGAFLWIWPQPKDRKKKKGM